MAAASRVLEVLARWRSNTRVAPHLVDVREIPGRTARFVDIPSSLDPRLVAALWDRGLTRLYSHQAEAIAALEAGSDVVVATPTASGKSLCYHLPVVDAILRDPTARALYLFPTKALARDQVASARELLEATRGGGDLGIAVYDGDTPPDERRAAKARARIVATNPDMLHAGILPHHASWASFFAGLKYVVVDEVHMCRGVFGAGVANVMRRLRRIAAFHGASPRFVCTSATIANPGEVAARVVGSTRLAAVTESGAPSGPRHFAMFNPPVIDASLGLRASYLKSAKRLARDLVDAGVSTLVFTRSRRAVEILVRYLRDDLDKDGDLDLDPDEAIRGYRGGYLPDRRREVERLLRDGETRCVVATSALELGIDVGGLDAVVIAGWPGSRAATWQRAGRAGRRGAPSLVVMVACSEPLDQYVAGDPEFLHGEPIESARLDPDNLAVLVPHLKCAAFELPFAPGETYGPLSADETAEILRYLAKKGLLHEDRSAGGGTFHWIADAYPAQGVPLRGPSDENFAVVDIPSGEVLAEVDLRDAARQLHVNAIYPLEARLYQVERLDWGAHKAFVRAVDVDYTTDAMTHTDVRVLETLSADGLAGWGEVHVEDRVVGFKKIKLHTHENVGYGEVGLPPNEMHTRALWFDPPWPAEPLPNVHDGVGRAAYALKSIASLIVMCDGGDLGRALSPASERAEARKKATSERGAAERPGAPSRQRASNLIEGDGVLPRIYLYDACAGGAGLSEKLYEGRADLVARALRLVEACGCARGCPACVGAVGAPAADPKAAAIQVLEELSARLAARGAMEVRA